MSDAKDAQALDCVRQAVKECKGCWELEGIAIVLRKMQSASGFVSDAKLFNDVQTALAERKKELSCK